MNIILFGPPGVGKSTLIGYLKSQGQRAIDLEDVYPNRIRFQLPGMLDHTFIGGADLNPKRSYPHAKKVLLFLQQEAYEARRRQRDAKVPGKGAQKPHRIESWRNGVQYDLELDVSGSPTTVAQNLIKYLREVDKC